MDNNLFLVANGVFAKSFKYVALVALFFMLPQNIIMVMLPEHWFFANTAGGIMPAIAVEAILLLFVVSVLFTPLSIAALTYIAKQTLMGEQISVYGILDHSIMRWSLLCFTATLQMILVLAGMFLFVLPAIYFGTIFVFYIMVVAEHGKWGMSALKHSATLVKGSFWKTFLIMTFTQLCMIIINDLVLSFFGGGSGVVDTAISVATITIKDMFLTYFTFVMIVHFYRMMYYKEGINVFTHATKP